MRQWFSLFTLLLTLSACGTKSTPQQVVIQTVPPPIPGVTPNPTQQTVSQKAPLLTPDVAPSSTPQKPQVPVFSHIIMIMFENRDYQQVIGSAKMPVFNQLARQNVLLTNYYAVTHPSLPNYIALIGGETFGLTKDCTDCWINKPSLPDLIEANGRTWKTYQEDMPAPCFIGNSEQYVQKHNPFVYFDPIRNNPQRCQQSVVSLGELDKDLAANQLPDFAFIMPNLCHSGHDCALDLVDQWLDQAVKKLQASLASDPNYLIYIAFEEGKSDNSSCCGLPPKAGGRVAAILMSPLAKSGYQDNTPLSHYSLLKTILTSWGLPNLGFTANQATQAITAPWQYAH